MNRHISVTVPVLVLSGWLLTATSLAASGTVAQTVSSDQTLPIGALVSLSNSSGNRAELANTANGSRLFGVVSEQASVSLADGSGGTTKAVVSGTTPTLVSDMNGTVIKGDPIAVSPLSGVGMKAIVSGPSIGTAAADLSSNITGRRTLADTSGADRAVNIGLIPVQISVAFYAAPKEDIIVPNFLRSAASAIAGREVSPQRIWAAIGVLAIGLIVTGVMLQAAIRASLSSIGRNPLAAVAIRKGLFQAVSVTVLVLTGCAFATYIILSV